MNDFELLISLQKELINTLENRKAAGKAWVTRNICRAKINRLRIQIQEVMLRIERKCISTYRLEKEDWY